MPPTAAQAQHQAIAGGDPALRADVRESALSNASNSFAKPACAPNAAPTCGACRAGKRGF
jgi:hypothetical protein